jgi:ABC-type bacteriocin/lantibiotic exporter with double-glycine peptidase domain
MTMNNNCWAASRGLPPCRLVDIMRIKELPDIRQKHDHDCGHAALRCLAAYHTGSPNGVADLSTQQHGTDPATIEAILRSWGWCVSAGERTLSELAYYCGDGRPVLTPIQRHGGGHYVVVYAVTRSRVWFQCPVDGASWLSHDEWANVWHDNGRYAGFHSFGVVAWPNH